MGIYAKVVIECDRCVASTSKIIDSKQAKSDRIFRVLYGALCESAGWKKVPSDKILCPACSINYNTIKDDHKRELKLWWKGGK